MNIDPFMKKRLVIGCAIFVGLLLLGGLFSLAGSSKKTALSVNGLPLNIITTAATYIKAHENAIGADQSSPTSWVKLVKPISTSEWYRRLQPTSDSSTGSSSYSYSVAHENNYRVAAVVNDCIWVGTEPNLKTSTSVKIQCAVYDNVVTSNGIAVTPGSLPYGWASVGQQSPTVLTLVEQNSQWLVDDQPVDQQTE